MDIEGLLRLVRGIEDGSIACVARDVSEPSPLSQEILGARPYAFLDDAPLEERRTQAIMQRRYLDPQTAQRLGALDPDAIRRVVEEAAVEARDADELHDALLVHGALNVRDARAFSALFEELRAARRAFALEGAGVVLWVAAERVGWWRLATPERTRDVHLPAMAGQDGPESREAALREIVRGRLELVGPTTVLELATALGLSPGDLEGALHALESEGFVLRGRFRPDAAGELEWCERRLLARIHRATLERLRAEIEPVSPAVYLRFLLQFQHVAPGSQMQGLEGLNAVVEQLAGFELAAVAWERDVLAARVRDYDPTQLDLLSYTGRVCWARARMTESGKTPIRTTPIALYPREQAAVWRVREGDGIAGLSADAQRVHAFLEASGASFFPDVARGLGLDKAGVEGALAELVASGRVSSDGFAGLRGLFTPAAAQGGLRRRTQAQGMEAAGRYDLLVTPPQTRDAEAVARALLARWGVLFRRVLDREPAALSWGELVPVLRRMEARGELRGGRFVAGFSGEQYALPDAVALLRKQRRERPEGQLVSLCAADPLNLIGILTPGGRLASQPRNRLLLEDGVPVAVLDAGEVRFIGDVEPARRSLFERVLTARNARLETRAYQENIG
jgi:ATP-dependent Lhr-like helicase